MQAPTSTTLTLLILIPLIGWRMYARFRTMVGRQRLSKARIWIRLILFPIILCLLAFSARAHADRLWCLAGGVALGALLGVFGLRKTSFEPTKNGLFYTPNAHLGIALSLLFVARIVFRIFELYSTSTVMPQGGDDFSRSALTLSVFGILAGYYITYAIGLARWRQRVLKTAKATDSLPEAG